MGRDCFLYGDDMHADAGAARRYQFRDACERQISHTLEKVGRLREHVRLLRLDHHNLSTAGYEHIENPAFFVVGVFAVQVFPVILHKTALTDGLQSFFQVLSVKLRVLFRNLLKGQGDAAFHGQGDIQDIIRHFLVILGCGKLQRGIDAEILRGLWRDRLCPEFGGHVVCNLTAELCNFLVFGHQMLLQ